ncbi:MAG: FMN-binding protein [Myxococcota bacterium]
MAAGGLVLVALAVLSLCALPAYAKVFHSRQEAISLAFPDADRVDKKTTLLTPEQVEAIQQAGRAKLESKLVTIFTAYRGDEVLGYAHIDVHTVRTHPAALMVVLGPEGDVRSVRILAFHEPLDYLPSEKWYAQFAGKTAQDRLRVGSDVHGVVNATLSTRVATDGIRRALAYHTVLIGSGD